MMPFATIFKFLKHSLAKTDAAIGTCWDSQGTTRDIWRSCVHDYRVQTPLSDDQKRPTWYHMAPFATFFHIGVAPQPLIPPATALSDRAVRCPGP